jgi:hypothetical protein
MDSPAAVVAETRDVSAEGFRCVIDEAFSIGETITFLIVLPEAAAASPTTCGLGGEAEVVRIVADPSRSSFEIGCHIRQFRVVSNPSAITVNANVADSNTIQYGVA